MVASMESPSPHEVLELALRWFAATDQDVDVAADGLVTDDGRVFGLEPLRRRLAHVDANGWDDAVEAHFRALHDVDPTVPSRFEEARGGLRATVVAAADMGMFDGALAERPLVDGVGERLMLKRGSLGLTVTTEHLDSWSVDSASVWETARSNVLWDEAVERVPTSGFVRLRGGSWTSTALLHVGHHVDVDPDFGALVSVPARDEVLVHPVRDDHFPESAVAMLAAAADVYVAAPLPVSCDLFWWRQGELERICTPGSDGYRYIRVPSFSRMLWRLEASSAGG